MGGDDTLPVEGGAPPDVVTAQVTSDPAAPVLINTGSRSGDRHASS